MKDLLYETFVSGLIIEFRTFELIKGLLAA